MPFGERSQPSGGPRILPLVAIAELSADGLSFLLCSAPVPFPETSGRRFGLSTPLLTALFHRPHLFAHSLLRSLAAWHFRFQLLRLR